MICIYPHLLQAASYLPLSIGGKSFHNAKLAKGVCGFRSLTKPSCLDARPPRFLPTTANWMPLLGFKSFRFYPRRARRMRTSVRVDAYDGNLLL